MVTELRSIQLLGGPYGFGQTSNLPIKSRVSALLYSEGNTLLQRLPNFYFARNLIESVIYLLLFIFLNLQSNVAMLAALNIFNPNYVSNAEN